MLSCDKIYISAFCLLCLVSAQIIIAKFIETKIILSHYLLFVVSTLVPDAEANDVIVANSDNIPTGYLSLHG